MRRIYLIVVLVISFISLVNAQDTIVSNDNTILIGEIKSMDRGVLLIETDFSDSDFKISWLKIKEINSQRNFRFVLSNGRRYSGTISMVDSIIVIHDKDNGEISVTTSNLVYIKQVDKGNILDIMNLSMDVGYSFTNANNLEQINANLKANYYTNFWGVNGFYSMVQSTQDNVEPIYRRNGGVGAKLFAMHGLFLSLDADYFSNNEQKMDLRSNYSASIGKFIIKTNRIFLNTSIGVAYLLENYSDTIPDRDSYEGKIAAEFNMFDLGDLNIHTRIEMYPSFTEKGRLRTLYTFTAKYDLPRDFYIKGDLNYNYDNKPQPGIDPNDYVYTFGIGWEL